MSDIIFKYITKESEEKNQIETIYNEAFPERERQLTFDQMLEIEQMSEAVKIKAAIEGDKVIGFMYFAEQSEYIYLLFFAVNKNMRDGGYGSKMIKAFLEENIQKPVIGMIETPIPGTSNYEQRVKRKIFYERVGILMSEYSAGIDDESMLTAVSSRQDGRLLEYFKDAMKQASEKIGITMPQGTKFYVEKNGKRVEINLELYMGIKYPLLLDGATGTQLQKNGYKGDMSTEEWVLKNPEVITKIQKAYVECGSQVVYASTFGANSAKFENRGLHGVAEEYNTKLAGISKAAVEGKALVAGDISGTGKFLYPVGDATFEEFFDIYTEQVKGLEAAGVDLYVVETMITLAEARAAVLAIKALSSKPVFVTFTCDENGRTLMGTDVTAALVVMQGMGVDAFGLNCSAGPDEMLIQIKRLREYAEIPLIAKPNAGLPEIINGETVYNCPPEKFVRLIPDFAANGVCIFGGCCGTDEGHIAALSEALKNIVPEAPSPMHAGEISLSTEKNPAYLPADISLGEPVPCGEDLEDDLMDAEDDDELEIIILSIADREELQNFIDAQYLIKKPICIACEDAEFLESALREFQGRAMYKGQLSEEILKPLSDKYGLVI